MTAETIDAECTGFEFYLKTETRLEPSTIRRYMVAIRRLLCLDVIADGQTFLEYCLERQKEGIDNYTLNKEISCLKHYLVFKGLTWDEIKYFKTAAKNKPSPTLEEIDQFLSIHTTDAMDMFWKIHIACGTRPGEVANLRLQDIDFGASCFYPQKTKTNDGKPIIMPPGVARNLSEYVQKIQKLEPIDYLFISERNRSGKSGSLITTAAINKDCRKRLKIMNCKMNYTAHSFRHAYITIGLIEGVPLQYIQRSVRHAKVQTTMQYFDKSVDLARKAAQAHPLYRENQTTDQIIEGWIEHIRKTADERFDPAKLQAAFTLLYEAVIVK